MVSECRLVGGGDAPLDGVSGGVNKANFTRWTYSESPSLISFTNENSLKKREYDRKSE